MRAATYRLTPYSLREAAVYSQNDEERHILEALGQIPDGTFLDIGAFDGKTFSNTLALLERGWRGALIEPSPSVFPSLVKNLESYRDRISLYNFAVSVEGGPKTFWDSQGKAICTLSVEHKDKWEANDGVNMTPYTVMTIGVQELLELVGTDFHFVNLDVEGTNWDLFSAIAWDHFTTLRAVCVEHDKHVEEMLAALTPLGFRFVTCNPENLIVAR